jgi:predicted TIM-barrel fold metal-dependent hydrolase
MIIDCHTHIFEVGSGGPFGLPASAADLVRYMDEKQVDVSVVLPLAGIASNEFVHDACTEFAGRLVPLYNPDFATPGKTIQKMEEFFDQYSPRGLKVHPRYQGVTVNDAVVLEVFHWAQEREVVILVDVFLHGPSLDNPDLHPIAYHRVAQSMPQLKMILAHAGGYKMMEAFMVAKSNPNIYLDLSFTPAYFHGSSIAEDCGFLCRRLPSGRVLYGSDFPYVPFAESVDRARDLMNGAGDVLSSDFWGDSAAALFGIGAK